MSGPAYKDKLAYYASQAEWTASLRGYLYREIAIGTRHDALDVGCGGGRLTAELAAKVRGRTVGCDVDPLAVAAARAAYPNLEFVACEPTRLPAADCSFDFVGCHFTLLWAHDPVALLVEMKRVTKPGGVVVALAEPDWGGFVEWPDFGLRDLMATALAAKDADPLAGRKLRDWFVRAGLTPREVGLTGGPWYATPASLDATWAHHRWTLSGFVDERKLRVLERKARRAWEEGSRLVHLPLAWAIAEPGNARAG